MRPTWGAPLSFVLTETLTHQPNTADNKLLSSLENPQLLLQKGRGRNFWKKNPECLQLEAFVSSSPRSQAAQTLGS